MQETCSGPSSDSVTNKSPRLVAPNLGMYALAIKSHEEVIVKPFEIARLSCPGSQYSSRIPDSHARHAKMEGAFSNHDDWNTTEPA